jgi:hypothetical protein
VNDPDADLDAMELDELRCAARAMRSAIRAHRDASGHDLCWYQPDLWALLPDTGSVPEIPAWPQFMRGCISYRAALDRELPDAPRIDREFNQ